MILIPRQLFNNITEQPEEIVASLIVLDLPSILSIDEYVDEENPRLQTVINYRNGGSVVIDIKFGDFLTFLNAQGIVNLTYALKCVEISNEVKRVVQ
jgi:hypothetical protein